MSDKISHAQLVALAEELRDEARRLCAAIKSRNYDEAFADDVAATARNLASWVEEKAYEDD